MMLANWLLFLRLTFLHPLEKEDRVDKVRRKCIYRAAAPLLTCFQGPHLFTSRRPSLTSCPRSLPSAAY
jgi:hypothetical protein